MNPEIYSGLGTTGRRKESQKDHEELQRLFDENWLRIRDFQKNSPDFIRSWQLTRIKELVRHAFDTVPLYREKYTSAGFNPNDLKDWSDFEELPLLTKEELINAFPNKFISSKHNFEFTTRSSGSSGKFVTVAVSPKAIYIDTIQGARQYYIQSGRKSDERDLTLFIYTDPWWVSSINGKYPIHVLPTTAKPQEVIKTIKELRPRFLSLYPTYLDMLRGENVILGDLGLELIVVHSEQSTRKHRKELSHFFKVPVLDEFSSEELTRIALECPLDHYHLEEDACYIEILDPKTKEPLPLGKNGLIIGTNLLNEATPIIRYSQGDLAAMTDYPECECGSNFRTISSPKGRVMDSVILPDGNSVPAACFMDLAYNWYLQFGVPVHGLRYQIIQRQKDLVDIYLVSNCFEITDSHRNIIKSSMYQLIPPEVNVNVHQVEVLPTNHHRKYRPVISQVPRSEIHV